MRRIKKNFKSNFINPIPEWLGEYRLIRDIWKEIFPVKEEGISLSIIEKTFMTTIIFIRSFSLIHIANFFKKYKIKSEISEFYVLTWFIFLLFILFNNPFNSLFVFIIVFYRLIDSLNYRLCILFVDRYKSGWGLRSLNRSLILILINYFEIIIGFAILYLTLSCVKYSVTNSIVTNPISSLYYSIVTITTLGYGDILPINATGQILVILELIFSFILVILILGVLISGVRYIKEKERIENIVN